MTRLLTLNLRTTFLAFAVLGSAAATSAAAQDKPFSFRDVEFMPRDQREAAVQTFVNGAVVVGQPVGPAIAAMRKAGAYCPDPRPPHRTYVCSHSSFQRHPGAGFDDITWRVRIRSAADGTVAGVTIHRRKAGQ